MEKHKFTIVVLEYILDLLKSGDCKEEDFDNYKHLFEGIAKTVNPLRSLDSVAEKLGISKSVLSKRMHDRGIKAKRKVFLEEKDIEKLRLTG